MKRIINIAIAGALIVLIGYLGAMDRPGNQPEEYPETWPVIVTLDGHSRHNIRSAEFSPDGSKAVTASDDRTAKIWDAQNGTLLCTLQGHRDFVYSALIPSFTGHTGPIYSAKFSPDGGRVVTASEDHTAKIWDAQTGAWICTMFGHAGPVLSAKFSSNGNRVLTVSEEDLTAKIWDAHDGKLIHTLRGGGVGPAVVVYSAEFSSDGGRVVMGCEDGTAKIWNTDDGILVHILEGHTGSVFSAEFSSDGDRVVTASTDGTAKIWNAADGSLIYTLAGHRATIYSAAKFSSDGSRVVTVDGRVRIWNAADGSLIHTLEGGANGLSSAEFSPDGSRIARASYGDGNVQIWNTQTGALIDTIRGFLAMRVHFSPGGERVIILYRLLVKIAGREVPYPDVKVAL